MKIAENEEINSLEMVKKQKNKARHKSTIKNEFGTDCLYIK